MSSADQIRLALQREDRRFKRTPPTFSDEELKRIQSIFSAIREDYPGAGCYYELAKRRVLAALLQISAIYEALANSWLIEPTIDQDIFGRICRDLIDEGLPVKTHTADVYGRHGFERKSMVLELT